MPERMSDDQLSAAIRQQAASLDFDLVRIAPAVSPTGFHPLLKWIDNGYAADMDWIDRRREAYQHPDGVMPGTRSVIVVALNYSNEAPDPAAEFRISRYAWGTSDYHTIIRRRLKSLCRFLREQRPEAHSRAVVDTAPLLERDFARIAGIGWFGKNTMLISREIGSWFFLGAVLTELTLEYDTPVGAGFGIDGLAVNAQLTAADAFGAQQHLQEGTFATSRSTYQGDELAAANSCTEILQYTVIAVRFTQMLQFDESLAGSIFRFRHDCDTRGMIYD